MLSPNPNPKCLYAGADPGFPVGGGAPTLIGGGANLQHEENKFMWYRAYLFIAFWGRWEFLNCNDHFLIIDDVKWFPVLQLKR